jgi:hypothetical protein
LIRLRQTGSDEENERERNRIAGELLLWFGSFTTSKIELDIERVLKEHERSSEHLSAPHPNVKPEDRIWSCHHESEFVELDGYRQETDRRPSLFLKPVRGSDASENLIERGWDIVAFPSYLVVEEKNTPILQRLNNQPPNPIGRENALFE